VKRPVLFDCLVDQNENCFPMIPSGAAHNEMILSDAVDEPQVTEAGKVLV
jgi:acetolactate synthase-1/2/3 large subunit